MITLRIVISSGLELLLFRKLVPLWRCCYCFLRSTQILTGLLLRSLRTNLVVINAVFCGRINILLAMVGNTTFLVKLFVRGCFL